MVTERVVALAGEPPTLLERDALFKRRARSARAVRGAGGARGQRAGAAPGRTSSASAKRCSAALVSQGLAPDHRAERLRDPFADSAGSRRRPAHLTDAQAAALTRVESLGPGDGALLFGVTGSGKTLVYLEAVRRALARGPRRHRAGAGDRPHAPDGEPVARRLRRPGRGAAQRPLRRRAGRCLAAAPPRRAPRGGGRALGGLRAGARISASSWSTRSTRPATRTARRRAITRDVAAVRARIEGASLVLGSATPSLETMAQTGDRLRLLRLARADRRPAAAAGRDRRPARRAQGARHRRDRLVGGARRRARPRPPRAGSRRCSCSTAGATPRSSSAPTAARYGSVPAAASRSPCIRHRRASAATTAGTRSRCRITCRACGHPVQQMRGVGTQQLEQLLAERYPEARVARMDLDTTSTKWSHQRILGAVERGEVDLLIGTQMIAKGLDFPNVTLVGVVDADTGLYLPDFRSAERTFQLLAQVAGRAGRGPKGGRVLVQTRHPLHHALVWAARHDAEGFLREERELRLVAAVSARAVAGQSDRVGRVESRDRRTGRRGGRLVPGADRQARAPGRGAGARAVPAGEDQGSVAVARAAQGTVGGPRADRAVRGAEAAARRESRADAGGRSTATPRRCCSGPWDRATLASALPPTAPDSRSPCPHRAPGAAPARARGRPLRSA